MKKKIREGYAAKVEAMAPNIEGLEPIEPKKNHRPLIYGALALAGVLAIALGLGLGLGGPGKSSYGRILAKAKQPVNSIVVSKRSAEIYKNFATVFAPLLLEEAEESTSLSLVDFFLNLSTLSFLSDDVLQSEVLELYGANSQEEITTAVKEIGAALASNVTEGGKDYGARLANSLWVDPAKTSLKEGFEDYRPSLEEDYYASLISGEINPEKVNQYLKETFEGFPYHPELKEGDLSENTAMACVSAYYVYDYFDDLTQERLKKRIRTGEAIDDYQVDGVTKEVPYLGFAGAGDQIYRNEGRFEGGRIGEFQRLTMDVFLPEEGLEPSEIIDDLVRENYETTFVTGIDEKDGLEKIRPVSLTVPCFDVESRIDIMDALMKENLLSSLFTSGHVMEKVSLYDLFVSSYLQTSITRFDYHGLYSASVTVSGMDAESDTAEVEAYEIIMDRPFAYTLNSSPLKDETGHYFTLPLLYGVIYEPGYEFVN